jgi:hypothetical protein
MFVENNDYEILTPSGWKDFRGISNNGYKLVFRIVLDDSSTVEATSDHYFFTNGIKIKLKDLKINNFVDTIYGPKKIKNIENLGEKEVFDVIEVGDINHQFIVNSCFITKNCDEFAFVKPRIAEDFWTAMSPTLATGGKCIITSTPSSDEDKFAEIWNGATKTIDEHGNEISGGVGINGFRAFTAHYNEVPGRDEEWANKESNKIGHEKFRREYQCEFITADETLIAPAKLLKLQGVEPIGKTHNQVRWYETISPNKTYLVSLDPSSGVGRDSSVIQVFCLPDMTQVAEWSHNRTSPSQQVKLMKSIINYIYSEMKQSGVQKGEPEICYTFENNAVGEAIIVGLQELGEDSIAGQLINEPKVRGVSNRRKGLNTNVRSKIQSCTRLKSLVESDKIKLYSKLLIRQLKFFVAKGDSFGGKGGEHDDTVSALLLCVRMMQIAMSWDDSIADLLRDTGENDEFEEPMPIFVMRR